MTTSWFSTESVLGYTRKSLAFRSSLETRNTLWVEMPFPIVVRGIGGDKSRFEEHGLLDILSVDRLYMRMARPISPGTQLFVFVKLALGEPKAVQGPGITAKCVVTQAELMDDNRCGLELTFIRYRFLFAKDD